MDDRVTLNSSRIILDSHQKYFYFQESTLILLVQTVIRNICLYNCASVLILLVYP